MNKLTVVAAVRNQIEYNRLFLDTLEKYSEGPYELIVVDNGSDDGSTGLFREHGAIVLRNEENHCYGCSQNQGIARASTGYIACLNNDLCLSPAWDARLIEHMEAYGLDAISPCGIETMESERATRASMRKWRWINCLQRLRMAMGVPYRMSDLRTLVRLMYGNWEEFTEKRHRQFKDFLYPGISGNAVLVRRSAFDRIGLWSADVGASDWDFQLRLVKRQAEKGDIRPSMVAGDVFVHHFIRATVRTVHTKSWCSHRLRGIKEAYPDRDLVYLDKPAISLVIAFPGPEGNTPERLFDALSGQTMTDFEIVVVDSEYDRAIARCIERWNGRFRYPIARVRPGGSGARDRESLAMAVDRARSGYLCFMEGDQPPPRTFLEDHFRARRVGAVVKSGNAWSLFKGDIYRLRGGRIGRHDLSERDGGLLEECERSGIKVRKIKVGDPPAFGAPLDKGGYKDGER